MTRRLLCFSALFLAASLLIAGTASAQCPTDPIANDNPAYDTSQVIGRNFNKVAMIFKGARDLSSTCRVAARDELQQYLQSGVDQSGINAFRHFLSGANITFVFAAALELGPHGLITDELDRLLRRVGNDYQLTFDADTCGLLATDPTTGTQFSRRGNSCMDDYMIAASGFGWKTAYFRLSGRSWAGPRNDAIMNFRNGLAGYSSVCIHSPALYDAIRGMSGVEEYFCNQTESDLDVNGDAKIISLNHGNQTPAYGFGLLTSAAAMHVALEVAEQSVTAGDLSPYDRKALKHLWKEAAEGTDMYGTFNTNCYDIIVQDNPYATSYPDKVLSKPYTCADGRFGGGSVYRGRFYPLDTFYSRYSYDRVAGNGYNFPGTGFDATPFFNSTDEDSNGVLLNVNNPQAFKGRGRYETYYTLAYEWFISRPTLTASPRYRMAVGTSGSRYLYATNRGGSTLNATGTSSTSLNSTYYLEDLSPTTPLRSGDTVVLRMQNSVGASYYLNAPTTGAVDMTATSTGTTARFTISRISGTGPITHLDKFALLASNGYYLQAVNGGNGAVTADSATTGTYAQFTFTKTETPAGATY